MIFFDLLFFFLKNQVLVPTMYHHSRERGRPQFIVLASGRYVSYPPTTENGIISCMHRISIRFIPPRIRMVSLSARQRKHHPSSNKLFGILSAPCRLECLSSDTVARASSLSSSDLPFFGHLCRKRPYHWLALSD